MNLIESNNESDSELARLNKEAIEEEELPELNCSAPSAKNDKIAMGKWMTIHI
jgi:hypothetical protein